MARESIKGRSAKYLRWRLCTRENRLARAKARVATLQTEVDALKSELVRAQEREGSIANATGTS